MATQAARLAHLRDFEMRVLKALESPETFQRSSLSYAKLIIDKTRPIYFGFKPERKHHAEFYWKVPIVSKSGNLSYIFVERDRKYDWQKGIRIIEPKQVKATFFVSRQDLIGYEKRALKAVKSPDVWNKAGLDYIDVEIDPEVTSEDRTFNLKAGHIRSILSIKIHIVEKKRTKTNSGVWFRFDLNTGEMTEMGYVKWVGNELVKSLDGKLKTSKGM